MQVLKWAGRRGGIPQFSLQMYLYGGESGGDYKDKTFIWAAQNLQPFSVARFVHRCLFIWPVSI